MDTLTGAAGAVAAVMLLAACADSSAPSADPPLGGCQADAPRSGFEALREPEVRAVPAEDANLTVDLSSTTEEPLRVTVRLDGRIAFDVEAPEHEDACGHAPVQSFGFRVPDGSVTKVAVVTGAGQRRNLTVRVEGRRWVAVQPQEGLPLGVTVYEEQPLWG